MVELSRVSLYLVRHAKAGDRREWKGPGPDHDRPLSKKGWRQAELLVDVLVPLLGSEPARIFTSPYTRCAQTVEPLAAKLGLEVENELALAEGANGAATLRWMRALGPAVLCSHGDVIPDVLDRISREDGLELPDDYRVAKASTWILEPGVGSGVGFVAAEYLPPPS